MAGRTSPVADLAKQDRRAMSIGPRMRRIVIWFVVELFVLAGAAIGIGDGLYFYDHHNGSWDIGFFAVLIGVGSALGAWLVASLLALFVEIANSLLAIVDDTLAREEA